jgi:hypothetical protein
MPFDNPNHPREIPLHRGVGHADRMVIAFMLAVSAISAGLFILAGYWHWLSLSIALCAPWLAYRRWIRPRTTTWTGTIDL